MSGVDFSSSETLRGVTFARWKEDAASPAEMALLAPGRKIAPLAASAVLALGVALAAGVVGMRNPELAQLLYLVSLGCPFATWGLLQTMDRGRCVSELPRSEAVPETAIARRVTIHAGDQPIGSTEGWMWVDEFGWLYFWGLGFDFRLQRLDLVGSQRFGTALLRLSELKLRLPDDLPELTVHLSKLVAHRAPNPDEERVAMETINVRLERWDEQRPSGRSLYPPLRPGPQILSWNLGGLPNLVVAIPVACSMVAAAVVATVQDPAGWGFALIIIAAAAALVVVPPYERRRAEAYQANVVDRLARSEQSDYQEELD